MSNWENPIRGVSDVVEDFLKNILDFYQRSDDKGYPDLIHDMWKSNHGTVTWKSKAKYPVIGILLPRLGAEDVKYLSVVPFTSLSEFKIAINHC